MQNIVKLVLRFAIILLTAELLQKFVVLLVYCSIYAWDEYNKSCLTLMFAVLVTVADVIDRYVFGPPSVLDILIEKLKGEKNVQ